jgi:hypothetical protein
VVTTDDYRGGKVVVDSKEAPPPGRTEGLGMPQPNPDGKGMRGPRRAWVGDTARRFVNRRALAWFRLELALYPARQ